MKKPKSERVDEQASIATLIAQLQSGLAAYEMEAGFGGYGAKFSNFTRHDGYTYSLRNVQGDKFLFKIELVQKEKS